MRFQIIAAFLPVFIALVNGFDLNCTATTLTSGVIGTITYCKVPSLTITSQNERITSVNGVTTPTTFQGIYFHSLTVPYLPKGLGTFFPHMRALAVERCGLKTIQAADLENLTALESLFVNYGVIEELESDLFKFTPNIKFVVFQYNQIVRVGKDLLTDLKSLAGVYFDGNKCISSQATSNFETFKATLRTQCPHPKDLSEDIVSHKKTISDLNKEISDLKAEIGKQNLDSTAKLLQISDLKAEMEKKNLDSSAKLLQISDLKAEISRMKKNCYNGLLDSSTKLLHDESARLRKCRKTKIDVQVEDGSDIVLNALNTTDTKISFGMTVASPASKIVKILNAAGSEMQPAHTKATIDQQNVLFLPVNFGLFFSSLQSLEVTFSGLYGLDKKTFLNMKKLVEVNFTGNKIVEIPESAFSELTNLKIIDLSHNNIEIISENAFEANANLEIVKLNHNKLSNIDSQLFHSHGKLQKLFLNGNQLKYINAKLWSSTNALELVDLSGNVCIDMSHPKTTMKEIESQIMNNCIAPVVINCKDDHEQVQMTDTDCEAEDVTLVYPGTRLLIADHDNKEQIEKLSVIEQNMLFLPFKLSDTLPDLVQLVVRQSQLTTLQGKDFEGLLHLQEIRIEHNNISLIEEGVFDAVPRITYLNLGHNNLKSLPPKAFAKLVRMKVLILQGNQLKKFAASLLPPRKNVIKDFQLQENQLEIIESQVFTLLRNADVIDFSYNECISMKYQKSDAKGHSIMYWSSRVEYDCADHSGED